MEKQKIRNLLNEARQIADQGDLRGAAQALSRLAEDYPDDMDICFFYASVLFRLKRYADAAPHFDRTLKARPAYEWASLGLFHSLWQIGRREEAIEEIRRFRDAGGDSMEYRRLFKDMSKFR